MWQWRLRRGRVQAHYAVQRMAEIEDAGQPTGLESGARVAVFADNPMVGNIFALCGWRRVGVPLDTAVSFRPGR